MDSQLVDFLSFLSFLDDIGISVDHASVQFVPSQIHGFGVIALRSITPRQVLATIPKSAILSVQTAALWREANLADPCPETISKDEWCPPIFQLAAAALFETLLGGRSPWHRYLRMLPTSLADIGVPLAESETNMRNIARGTGIDKLTAQMHKSLRSAYDRVCELFVNRAQKLGIPHDIVASPTYEQFALAFAWVTSRAFHVDSFHGNSLVPVADMFNHSTDGEHVHIEGPGQDDSDEEDDSDGEHDNIVDEEEAANGNDIEEKDVAEGRKEPGDVLQIVCVRCATAGKEIFNTFGQKCNTILYLNYGFTERNNAYDTAFLHKSDVESVLNRFMETVTNPEQKMTPQRLACIDTASVIVFDDVVDDFFQISADSLCHGLLVLIFLHVVPWPTLAPMCNDEFELLEYIMQLSIGDMMQAGYKHMALIISNIANAQLSNFPAGSCVPSDMAALRKPQDLSTFMTHILRIRIGQRVAMEKALKNLLNFSSGEDRGPNLKRIFGENESAESDKNISGKVDDM